MKHSKIYQISAKNETNTKKIHYINADNESQAIEKGKLVFNYIETAYNVTESHFNPEEKENLPDYVLIASEL